MKLETRETIIWIFCIVVLLSMAIKLNIDSSDYNCEECTVTLSNSFPTMDEFFKNDPLVIVDLFESFVEGKCEVTWNPTQGFMKNG